MTDEQKRILNSEFATAQWATSRQPPSWKLPFLTEVDGYPFDSSYLPTDLCSIPIDLDLDTQLEDQLHGSVLDTSQQVTGPGSTCILDEAHRFPSESISNASHLVSKQSARSIPTTPNNVTANTHIGRWSKREHELFLHGLKLYGKSWKKISKLVSTRTLVQIRTHAQKYLQKQQRAAQKMAFSAAFKDDRVQDESSCQLNTRAFEFHYPFHQVNMESDTCESTGLDVMLLDAEQAAMRDDVIECLLCPSPKRRQSSSVERGIPMLLNESFYWETSTPREATKCPKSFVASSMTHSGEAIWMECARDNSSIQWNSQYDDTCSSFSQVTTWHILKEQVDSD
ncbi:hypothetical protein ABG067_004740 [Albugo candida]